MSKSQVYEQHNKDVKQVAKGAGIAFSGQIIRNIFGFIRALIFARYLGPALFGLFSLGLTVTNIANILSVMGLDQGTLRYVSLYNGEKSPGKVKGTIIVALKTSFLATIFIVFIQFFSSDFLAEKFFKKPDLAIFLKYFAFSLPFAACFSILTSALKGLKNIRYLVYVRSIIRPLMVISTAIIFFIFGLKTAGAISAQIIGAVIGAISAIVFVNKAFPLFNRHINKLENKKELFHYSYPLSLASLLGMAILWIDIVMLGYFSTASDIGIYRVATRTALMGTIFLGAFNTMFAPMISDIYHKGERKRLNNLFKSVSRWIFMSSLPIFLFFIFFSKSIMHIFGPQYVVGYISLTILCLGQLLNITTSSVGIIISMSGRSKLTMVNNIIVVILNISLNYLLIPRYGIIGAAVATAISVTTVNIIMLAEVFYTLRIHPYSIGYYKPLLAGLSSIFIVYQGSALLSLPDSKWLVLFLFPIFLSIYGASLLLFGFEKEDMVIANAIKARLNLGR